MKQVIFKVSVVCIILFFCISVRYIIAINACLTNTLRGWGSGAPTPSGGPSAPTPSV